VLEGCVPQLKVFFLKDFPGEVALPYSVGGCIELVLGNERDYHHHWGKPWTGTSVLTCIDQLQYFLGVIC